MIRSYWALKFRGDGILASFPVLFKQSIPFFGDSSILTVDFSYRDIKLLDKLLTVHKRLSRFDSQQFVLLFQVIIVDILEVDLF